MIPLRIYLKGFMSYRDETTISFDGASLWVLIGPNGAGKSALFDAITFVLYGTHRAGIQQHHQDVINHRADSLTVEFDFQMGGNVFRAKRTVTRRARTTFQAWQQRSAPGVAATWEPIIGTEAKVGFDGWIAQTIGLGMATFTASVLLQQGKSDEMLEADANKRHEMLSQMIDLSAYQRLYQRADDERRRHRALAEDCAEHLRMTPTVSDADAALLLTRLAALQRQVDDVRRRCEELAVIKVQATQWEHVVQQRTQLAEEVAQAKRLLEQAERITRDAARSRQLAAIVPQFQHLLEERALLEGCLERIDERKQCVRDSDEQIKTLGEVLTSAESDLDQLNQQLDRLRQGKTAALEAIAKLSPDIASLDTLDQNQHDITRIDGELARFSADLDQQIALQRQTVATVTEIKGAIPWLKNYVAARTRWLAGSCQRAAAQQATAELGQQLDSALQERAERGVAYQQAQLKLAQHQQSVTEAHTLLNEARKRLKRLHEVDGKPECSYCGQPLTPAHLEAERVRLNDEVAVADRRYRSAEDAHRVSDAAVANLRQQVESLDQQVETLKGKKQHEQHLDQLASEQQAQSVEQAPAFLGQLPRAYVERIRPTADLLIDACFTCEYPTTTDLTNLQAGADTLAAEERRLERLSADAQARLALDAERRPIAAVVVELARRYPTAAAAGIRGAYAAARASLQDVESEVTAIAANISVAEHNRDDVRAGVKTVETDRQQALRDRDAETTRQGELLRNLSHLLQQLPPPWHEEALTMSITEVAALRAEQETLGDAERQERELAEAGREQGLREQRLRDLDDQVIQIPVAARRPATDVVAEEEEARLKQTQVEAERRATEMEQQQLEARQCQRKEWEEERQRGARRAYLYGELARLLGRDHLQRYLLHQAEAGIVLHANAVLDRISAGTLELELVSGTTIADGGAAKALDLIVHNKQTGTQPMRVCLLSGSQRFRVAVSLAIGIGRYAGQGSRHMDSVIIDEGFGSLDQAGLREMSEELHRLSDTLGRIILVSHQDDFAREFRHKYEIALAGGSSTATLVD